MTAIFFHPRVVRRVGTEGLVEAPIVGKLPRCDAPVPKGRYGNGARRCRSRATTAIFFESSLLAPRQGRYRRLSVGFDGLCQRHRKGKPC